MSNYDLIQASFEPYTEDELILIARKSAKALQLDITDDAIANIAAKSRGVPRILNRYLLRARDVAIYSKHPRIDSSCVVEPWLLKLRLIVKTAQGRQITELGLKHMGHTSFQEMRLI